MRTAKILGMILVICTLAFWGTYGVRADQESVPRNPCVVYGSLEMPGQNARILSIDLKQNITRLVGVALPKAHVTGLAVHPVTGDLYALVVNATAAKMTSLVQVDPATGSTARIGATGFDRVEGLSFRPADATLWGWWRGHGLVQINPATGSAGLVRQAGLEPSGMALAWDPTGQVLYLGGNRSLWAYDSSSDALRLVAEPLPVSLGGIATRGDGQLLLVERNTDASGLMLLVFDPQTAAEMTTFTAPVDVGHRTGKSAVKIESLTWPIACGNPSPGGEAELIWEVRMDKPQVRPGEAVTVQVDALHPEGGGNPVLVWINGRLGNERTLRFEGAPGPRHISVSAQTAEGHTDSEHLTVELLDTPPLGPYPKLAFGMNPFRPYTVDFRVGNAEEIAPAGAAYLWTFGDGAQDQTEGPFVSHSYEDALPPDQEYAGFEVTVVVRLPDGTELLNTENVVVWNAGAANRKRGLIQLRTVYDPELVVSGVTLTGPYTLRNLENFPITLTGRWLVLQPCDPDADLVALDHEVLSISLGPGEELPETLTLNSDVIQENVCGVELHFEGEAGPGRYVASNLYFQVVPNPLFRQPVNDPATLAMLKDVSAVVPDPDYITDEDIYQLSQQGLVVVPPSAAAAARGLQAPTAAADQQCDHIGCECLPGDPSPNPGLTCQATDEFDRYPPHLPNAMKGDVILVGMPGYVGEMLNLLGQKYAHTGIMTKNFTEIAHSTTTDKQPQDHLVNPFPFLNPHIDPGVLRYGWPGAIREDVATAFSRKRLIDPFGNPYDLFDFTPEISGPPTSLVPPLVVKPPPELDQIARPLLHAAADIAVERSTYVTDGFEGSGTGHYRYYAYTNGAIATDEGYDHPEHEAATVCSSFVWMALKEAGATLEGDALEAKDCQDQAQVDAETKDGIYLYPENLRKKAADFGWSEAVNMVMIDMADRGVPELPSVARNVANQLINCFILDECGEDATGSSAWKDPGIGRAVSPDNILWWDPPEDTNGDGLVDHGAYGYSERLVYRSGGWKRIYRFARSKGAGVVEGWVKYNGQPVFGATVRITAGELVTESGPDGFFRFAAVLAGNYEVEAYKETDDAFLSSGPVAVTVPKGETINATLELKPPPEQSRKVTFTGDFYYQDTQWSWYWLILAKKTIRRMQSYVYNCAASVDPYFTTQDDFWWQQSRGNSSLTFTGTVTYCDGEGSCNGCTDCEENGVLVDFSATLDSQRYDTDFYLAPLGVKQIEFHLQEKDYTWYSWPWYDWDKADVWLTVSNGVQN